MSWGVFPWVYPVWDSLGFLDLGDYFLPHFREVFNYYLLKYFLTVFLFVFFFWDSYDSNVGAFNIVPEVSEIVLISLNLFFFFLLCFIYFYHSIFYPLILSSASIILLLVPSRVFLISFTAAAARSLQSCLTLCDPIDGSPPGSPVPGILQARTLEWVAISFSNA